MKNNSTKLLLLLGVVALWGYIGYLIYGYINPTELSDSSNNTKNTTLEPNQENQTLSLDYSDPFLKNQQRKRSKPAKSYSVNPVPKPAVTAAIGKVMWPKITYMGFVKGSSTQIMLNYNGKTKVLALGQALDSFQISAINSDKLTLSCNGEQRNYSK